MSAPVDVNACLDTLAAEVVRLGSALENSDARYDVLLARVERAEQERNDLRRRIPYVEPGPVRLGRGRNFDSKGAIARVGLIPRRRAS